MEDPLMFGYAVPRYIISFLIVLVFYLLSHIIIYITAKMAHLASKTKTTLDDHVINSLRAPLKILFVLGGIYLALYYYDTDLQFGPISMGKVFVILWIFAGAYATAKIIKAIFNWYGNEISTRTKTDIDETLLPFLRRIVNIGIYIIALLVIFDKLGIEIGPMLAGLGIAGLAVALALQDTLSNFFSAVYMAIDRPIKVGDYIELENALKGYVDDIGWRSTRIRTLPGNIVVVPNAKLSQTILTNYNAPRPEMSLVIPLGVSYDSDLDKVEKVIVDVAQQVIQSAEGGVKEFTPFIRYKEFGESSINLSVILRVRKFVDQYPVQHEFMKQLHKRFKKEGIEIPFPQRVVHTKSAP